MNNDGEMKRPALSERFETFLFSSFVQLVGSDGYFGFQPKVVGPN